MSVVACPAPILQFFDNEGNPAVGGSLLTQVAGVNYVTYSNSGGSIALPNPIPLNSRGEVSTAAGTTSQLFLVPNTVYTFTLFDSSGNQLWTATYVNGVQVTITQASIGALLYPISAAETAAGVTVVNFYQYYGYVDRYGTNSVPGTTDMTVAWQAAINQAKQFGGTEITFDGTTNYLVTAALDCTWASANNAPGIKIRQIGGGIDTGNGIVAKHTQVAVFDCTGMDWVVMEDVTITTNGTTFPQVGFLHARNAGGHSCFHRLTRVKFIGNFSVACYYNYGTEGNVLEACYLNNNNPAAVTKTAVITGNNTKWALASAYTTIYSGAVSTTVQDWYGCYHFNNSSTATTDCVYVEGTCNGIHSYGGYAYTTAGRALWYFDMATGPSNYVTIDSVKGDVGAQDTLYGVLFSNDAQTPIGFSIRNCEFPNYTFAIACVGSNPTLNGFYIENINEQPVSHGISIPGTLQSSYLSIGETNLIVGISNGNTLIGDTSRWTITTRVKDYWVDQGATNKTIATVTSTGITSSSGPLIARARLSLNGPCLTFNIVLGSTSGNLAVSAGATITLTAPGGQSLALSDVGTCMVVDQTAGTINGAAVAASSANALITIPVAVSATTHTVIVTGTVFLA